jgi:hypothetical protein
MRRISRRIAEREVRLDDEAVARAEIGGGAIEVGAVLTHLLGLGQLQRRGPTGRSACRCCSPGSGRRARTRYRSSARRGGVRGEGHASLALARVDLPIAWLEWELFLPDRLDASRFEGAAIPRALVAMRSGALADMPGGLAETVTVTESRDKRAERQAANESNVQQQLSLNVQNLQRRASGVLPVRLDVPRSGQSHTFVRPLVMDEETRVAFRYKLKK